MFPLPPDVIVLTQVIDIGLLIALEDNTLTILPVVLLSQSDPIPDPHPKT